MSTVDWAMIGGISAAGLVFAVAAIIAVVKWDQFLEADSQDGRDQVAREQGAPIDLDVDWTADTELLTLPAGPRRYEHLRAVMADALANVRDMAWLMRSHEHEPTDVDADPQMTDEEYVGRHRRAELERQARALMEPTGRFSTIISRHLVGAA